MWCLLTDKISYHIIFEVYASCAPFVHLGEQKLHTILCDIKFKHKDRVSHISGSNLPCSVVSDLALDGSVLI